MPIALGLHGIFLVVPLGQDGDQAPEKPRSPQTAAVVQLPPQPSAPPQPKPATPVQPKSAPANVTTAAPSSAQQPSPSQPSPAGTEPSPSASPSASPTPSPTPSSTPSLTPSPTPSPTPDAFQLNGAKPCGILGCFQLSETNGRLVAQDLEQKLTQQGYSLSEQDIADDTGMKVYKVTKDNQLKFYLHAIWSDRGTLYIQKPTLVGSRDLLAQEVGWQ
jgi:hypothetical protein